MAVKPIPDDVMAAGNPARVIRPLRDGDVATHVKLTG